MNKAFWLFVLLTLLNVNVVKATNISFPDFLSSISVQITLPDRSTGSGIAFTRKDSNGKDVTLIWTAGHACMYREKYMAVFIGPITNGNKISTITRTNMLIRNGYYTNAVISQDIVVNGETKYTNIVNGSIIKCSRDEDDGGNDLGLIRINGKFFNENTFTFDLSNRIPNIGEPLYNIASPFGEYGTYSFGVISFVGRKVEGVLFDQASITVFPGSSGSGIFNSNGNCMGIILLMKAPGMAYYAPIRRMQRWAKEQHVEWALDPSIPMPSDEELKKLPIPDVFPEKITNAPVKLPLDKSKK